MNYRLKNFKSSQSNNNKTRNYINFLNSIPASNSPNLEKRKKTNQIETKIQRSSIKAKIKSIIIIQI